ncbi:MAG: IscS subfamily cysteine desulfurase [Gammaproteobacteria bacterium]|nr:IscS subfamily cysteine desulfurase [Gammaproteobacteria bacterium]
MALDIIYLDYAATTPIHPDVVACMQQVQTNSYFNPASNHIAGRLSSVVIDNATTKLSNMFNASQGKFLWTSSATESNNLAILGAAKQRAHRGKHLITMRTEHKAVVDVFSFLEKQGFEVTWLQPDSTGKLSVDNLKDALRGDTQLVSIMHINNEIGTIQDIKGIGLLCREKNITFHVDGAQASGKIVVDLSSLPVDLYSISAHKFYGPKGIGALYVANNVVIKPIMFGGNQQLSVRPGTLPVDLIAGLGEAASISQQKIKDDLIHLLALKNQLIKGLKKVDGLYINGPEEGGYPGILNVGVKDVNGESLLHALEPLCVATGSACNSQSQEPSYVLKSIGRSDSEAQSSIRFSFGRLTTSYDIEKAIFIYCQAVEKLRSLSPGQHV